MLTVACAQHAATASHRDIGSPRLRALLDPIMERAVADGNIPGGVLLIGHNGRVVYRRAFGFRSLEPIRERMTVDTIFDLASLTKCVATTTSIMKLVQEGRVRLNDPAASYLPEFAQNGKQDITIRELLTHYSGLAPDLDLQAPWTGRDTAFALAMAQKPVNPPGSRFVYSDINFEVLGFIVEKSLRPAPRSVHPEEHLHAARHEPHSLSAARTVAPAYRAHRIRRTAPHAAR